MSYIRLCRLFEVISPKALLILSTKSINVRVPFPNTRAMDSVHSPSSSIDVEGGPPAIDFEFASLSLGELDYFFIEYMDFLLSVQSLRSLVFVYLGILTAAD